MTINDVPCYSSKFQKPVTLIHHQNISSPKKKLKKTNQTYEVVDLKLKKEKSLDKNDFPLDSDKNDKVNASEKNNEGEIEGKKNQAIFLSPRIVPTSKLIKPRKDLKSPTPKENSSSKLINNPNSKKINLQMRSNPKFKQVMNDNNLKEKSKSEYAEIIVLKTPVGDKLQILDNSIPISNFSPKHSPRIDISPNKRMNQIVVIEEVSLQKDGYQQFSWKVDSYGKTSQ